VICFCFYICMKGFFFLFPLSFWIVEILLPFYTEKKASCSEEKKAVSIIIDDDGKKKGLALIYFAFSILCGHLAILFYQFTHKTFPIFSCLGQFKSPRLFACKWKSRSSYMNNLRYVVQQTYDYHLVSICFLTSLILKINLRLLVYFLLWVLGIYLIAFAECFVSRA